MGDVAWGVSLVNLNETMAKLASINERPFLLMVRHSCGYLRGIKVGATEIQQDPALFQ